MSATKIYLQSIFDYLYGPYQKRLEFSIQTRTHFTDSKSDEISSLQSGELAKSKVTHGNITIHFSQGSTILTIPYNSKIETLQNFGWKSIWDGMTSCVSKSPHTIEINLSGLPNVRIIDAKQITQITKIQTKDPGFNSGLDWRDSLSWGARGIGSIFAHIALLLVLMNLKNLNLPWDTTTVSIENSAEEKPSAQVIDVAPAQIGDYSGTGLAGYGVSAAERQQAASDARAKAVSNGLSGLASKLSGISFGQLNIAVGSGGKGDSKALSAVQSGLSQSQGSGLNNSLEKMAQGIIGKGMKWGMYGGNGQGISQKDQEEVAQIFRSLQAEFRGCYESALMKDESLSVTLNYEATIQATGTLGAGAYDISGSATDEGQKSLTSCLSKVLSRVKVSKNLSGIKVKNQFIFKS